MERVSNSGKIVTLKLQVKIIYNWLKNTWRKYYQYRISRIFQSLWKDFTMKYLSLSAQPLFYQYVTEKIFQEMIKITFRTHKASIASSTIEELTYEEANAPRYVAGYICFKIRKNISSSSHPMKDKILFPYGSL